MAITKIRGNTQIIDATIENAQIAADAAIETTKLAEGAELIKRDGSVVITGDFNFDSNKITNLPAPVADSEPARKLEVDAEAAARAAGDASTLASANSYTDAKVAEVLDGAPELLDTLNELAAAVGDDPAFFTNIQNNIDAEETARIAADAAIQSDLDVAEAGLAQELLDRAAGDAAVQANLDTEEAARISGDADLQAQLDAIGTGNLPGIEADIDAVEAALAQEIVDRAAADAAIQSDLDVAEAGLAQEIVDRAAGDAAVQANLDAEETARIAGDASTLASAQSYTDTAVANLVDSAPEVLDTLNELAAALGDDPNFATTVAGQVAAVQAEVDAEEVARAAADAAIQSDLDVAEAGLAQEIVDRAAGDDLILEYKPDQILYVSKNGDDSNVGSEHLPFLSIGAALSSITDASPTKRYAIRVSSGEYVEPSLELKANVFIVGETAKEMVRINSAISMDSSFDGNGDNRSGLANVLVLGACDFDWNVVTSAAGKIYCTQTVFGSTVNLNGYNNATAQAQFADCQFFGKLTISGINVSVFHNNICWSDVELLQHPNGGMATIFNAVGGTISGEFRATTTVDDFGRRCSAFLKSCFTGQIVIDGIKSYVDATNDSIPSAGATILNSGNLVRLNDSGLNKDLSNLSFPTAVNQPIMPATSNTTNFGDWGKQWMWNFGYVHASTGSDLYVISYGASYGADSEGKNIILLADGAGLQENVDGGNISLSTAAVSGTGVRGKIQLDGLEIDVTNKQVKNLADATDATDAVTKQQLDANIASAQTYTDTAVANLVDSAPELLDTLNELAAALGDDPNFATTVAGQVAAVQAEVDAEEVARAAADADLQSQIDALDVAGVAIADVVTREVPTGSVDGSNAVFTLAASPVAGTEHVYVNGLLQEPGAGEDYTISGATVTFATAPESGDRIRVSYIKQ